MQEEEIVLTTRRTRDPSGRNFLAMLHHGLPRRLCHDSGGELEQIQFLPGMFQSKRRNATSAASSV
jgi:hypothetical protein